jgi:hypothetical protein
MQPAIPIRQLRFSAQINKLLDRPHKKRQLMINLVM